MVKGLDTFRRYFKGFEDQYVLIGGAACDIVFESNETTFRATRDLDIVLIVEALTPEFGEKSEECVIGITDFSVICFNIWYLYYGTNLMKMFRF